MDRENQAELLVGDYKLAIERGVETVLWKHHYSRIGTFRSEITAAKKDRNAPALTVAQAAFREFLDDAIFFYVRLVIRLAEAHSLKRVIRIFVMHQALRSFVIGISADNFPITKYDNKGAIVMSCFQSIIYLGDLARYRDSVTPNASPSPQFYYNLAHTLVPISGNPFNQLAVIPVPPSTEHADLIYADLYIRALCCRKPFITARKNLEVCLGKQRSSFEGVDGALEAARSLLIGIKNPDQEWSENDFELRVKVPVIGSFDKAFGDHSIEKEPLERVSRILVGAAELLELEDCSNTQISNRCTSAFRLILSLTESAASHVASHLDRVQSNRNAEDVFYKIRDCLSVLRIMSIFIRRRFEANESAGSSVSDSFWDKLSWFCNSTCSNTKSILHRKHIKSRFSLDREKDYVGDDDVDGDLVGFLAVDDRMFAFDVDGECKDDAEFGDADDGMDLESNTGISSKSIDGREETSHRHWEIMIVRILRNFYKMSLLVSVPLLFDGIRWKVVDKFGIVLDATQELSKENEAANDDYSSSNEKVNVKETDKFAIGRDFFSVDLAIVASLNRGIGQKVSGRKALVQYSEAAVKGEADR